MAHLDYDNAITTYASSRADSSTGAGQHDRGIPVTHRPGHVPGLGQRTRADLSRVSKFLVVGGSGVLVNSLALLLLFQGAHLPLVVASILSAELAIGNNFWWNDRWTFKGTQLSWHRFARFNLVSLGGLVITTCTLWILAGQLHVYYLAANLLGIALATAWSFVANSFWTWGGVQ